MAKLSVLIPACSQDGPKLSRLVESLLRDTADSLEVLVGTDQDAEPALPADPRASCISFKNGPSAASQWVQLVEAATGDWVCLVHASDALETDLSLMLGFVETANPAVDAFGWNALEIDPGETSEKRHSIAIPTDANIMMMDKPAMMKAFFMWENSRATPRMPFGLYHGAIKRALARNIAGSLLSADQNPALQRWEWAARVLLMAQAFAFSNRPMSAMEKIPHRTGDFDVSTSGFPFNGGLGISAAIAEVQNRVLSQMGANWGLGAEAAFVRACSIDCISETEKTAFDEKVEAYKKAFQRWNPAAAQAFNPAFTGGLSKDTRQGLQDGTLFVSRFIGGARDAQSFFHVLQSFLQPVSFICQ